MDISNYIRSLTRLSLFVLVVIGAVTAVATPPNTSDNTVFPAVPPNISTTSSKPMLMLVASKDHTLFSPIYTDFEDLDGDGFIDNTFIENFKYYGYFDATKCYVYSTSDNQFSPNSTATLNGGRYVCGGTGQWSGNFLNWASMTRMDTVRKMLYGGERWVDSSSATVLQVARLSTDSHSFVKHYAGPHIRDYTPFTEENLTKTTGQNANNFAGLTICNTSTENNNGDNTTNVPVLRMAKGNYRLWATVEAAGSVPFVCKWGAGSTVTLENTPYASKRFGGKIFDYFGGTESYQGQAKLPNNPTVALQHEREFPKLSDDGAIYSGGPASATLNARVAVCVTGQLGQERCKAYGSGSDLVYKPIGLLQDFGVPETSTTAAKAEFGLITGSYDKNLTAGALRKNINDLYDEINPTTGQFCFKARSEASTSSNCPSGQINSTGTPADTRSYTNSGVIRSLDEIVLFGKTAKGYDGSNFQQPSELTNGVLPAWGNPVGEMVVQALNYYAGLSSTNPTSTTNDNSVGLPVSTWTDPLSDSNTRRTTLYGKSVCRPLNQLVLSSSALSFDHDDADAKFGLLPTGYWGTLSGYTDKVGSTEGIAGTLRAVGSVNSDWGDGCTGKTVTLLSDVTGVCPVAPALKGSYKVAGAALYANTHPIRTISSPPSDLPKYALKVKTYAASLAGGSNTLEIPIPNSGKSVFLTPESLADISGKPNKKSTAAGLTFDTVSKSADGKRVAFVVTWNNTPFGGDYDMDTTGYLMYEILDPQSPSTNYRLKVTTDILNVGAGNSETHGFSVTGTNFDGRYLTHLHSTRAPAYPSLIGSSGLLCANNTYNASTDLAVAALGSTFPPMTGNGFNACNGDKNLSSGGNSVTNNNIPISITFEMIGANDVILRDPLWYAAKYGAFTAADQASTTELPDSSLKWDARRNDGKSCGGTTGVSCQDGEPDGYFLARRPELLEQQLRTTLEGLGNDANAAPAVSSSQLINGGYKYVASFDSSNNSGSVVASTLDASGSFTFAWDSGQKLTTVLPDSRVIITNDGNVGKAWRESAVSGTALTAFSFSSDLLGGTALTPTQGNELINYLRGDRSNEHTNGNPSGIWRARSINNIMGTVVNSSPWVQTRPSAMNIGTVTPSYSTFVAAQSSRDRLIWAGSNDGMLHGFKADGTAGGTPVLSYIPSPLISRLRAIAQSSGQIVAGMDGSPFTGDVVVGSTPAWRTYLFSSLGRGGRALFALDVTSPAALTEANAASIYKWTFSSDDDSDLGYVVSDTLLHPVSNQATPIVRMNNGKYAVLVPNGLGSTSGQAYLFVLFVDGSSSGAWTQGTHYIKIPTDTLGTNGLMGVNWADTNSDGKADLIYATDAQGRLWKFDVSSATPSDWKSAFLSGTTPIPLFEAYSTTTQRLSASTAPVLSYPDFGGIMVGFGTGRSISSGDFPDASKTQRFISVYDRLVWKDKPSDLTSADHALPNKDLSTLVPRIMKRLPSNGVYVDVAGNIPFDMATYDGWYINFPAISSGSTINNELVLSSPRPKGGNIFIKTVRPSAGSADQCFASPKSEDYEVDPFTGTPISGSLGAVEVTLADGTIGLVYLAGVESLDQKSTTVLEIGTGKTGKRTTLGKDDKRSSPAFNIPSRRQWREIPGMRTDQ